MKNVRTFAIPNEKHAEIAQLVEHNLAKVRVASSSLVFRSKKKEVSSNADLLFENYRPTGFNYMSVVLVHKVGFFVYYSLDLRERASRK